MTTPTPLLMEPEPAPPPSVYQAMAAVMKDIGAVEKKGRNEQQKYSFRGIDHFLNAAHPAMVNHGVFVLPEVLTREVEYHDRHDRQSGKVVGMTTHVALTVRYTFCGPAGDQVSAVTVGEAADTSDKATNKAMSAAFKYALMQVFAVPLESEKDGDAETPEMGTRRAAPKVNAEGEPLATRAQTARFTELCELQGLDKQDRADLVQQTVGKTAWRDVTQADADTLITALEADTETMTDNAGRAFEVPAGAEPFEVEPSPIGGDNPDSDSAEDDPVGFPVSHDEHGAPVPPKRGRK